MSHLSVAVTLKCRLRGLRKDSWNGKSSLVIDTMVLILHLGGPRLFPVHSRAEAQPMSRAKGRNGHATVSLRSRLERCLSSSNPSEALHQKAAGWQSLEHDLLWKVGSTDLVLEGEP